MRRKAGAPIAHYTWHIRTITVPGIETDLSVMLTFDNEQYLFGAGEGTQRALMQRKIPSSVLRAVLVGDGRSSGRTGLPGLLMSKLDDGIKELDVIGPSDLNHYLATHKYSVYRAGARVNIHSHPNDATGIQDIFRGEYLRIQSIALKPPPAAPSPSLISGSANPWELPRAELSAWCSHILDTMFPGPDAPLKPTGPGLDAPLPVPFEDETATDMVYILRGPDILGKFDNAKATLLKIPDGKVRGQLVGGQTIEFPDPDVPGELKVVKPEEVVGKTMPGPTVILSNCSDANLDALISNPDLVPLLEAQNVAIMVHRISESVLRDPRFQEWTKAFGPNTKHLIANTSSASEEVIFRGSAWSTLKMSALDEEIFPLPRSSPPQLDPSILPPNSQYLAPDYYHTIHPAGRPAPPGLFDVERDQKFPYSEDAMRKARKGYQHYRPDFWQKCEAARYNVRSDPRWLSPSTESGADITVTTLGTGSALPSKYRNVSCTHIDVPGWGGMFLDCGENSVGQLRRRFGDDVQEIYEKLKVVFISHMHADHHLGLQRMLEDRFMHGVCSRLYLVAPQRIAVMLAGSGPWQYKVPQDALDNIVFIDNMSLSKGALTNMQNGSPDESEAQEEGQDVPMQDLPIPKSEAFKIGRHRWPSADILERNPLSAIYSQAAAIHMREDLGIVGLRAPLMKHRGLAWGLALEHRSGWKIAYSGDTMPCNSFIDAARNATLMIHEATLEDEEAEMAAEKGHSTFSQAIDIGYRARAKHFLLNHFSQRYAKVARLQRREGANGEDQEPVLAVSFDMMSIKVRDMWRMGYYMNALETLFAADGEEDEETDPRAGTGGVNGRATGNGGTALRREWSPSKRSPPPMSRSPAHPPRQARPPGPPGPPLRAAPRSPGGFAGRGSFGGPRPDGRNSPPPRVMVSPGKRSHSPPGSGFGMKKFRGDST